MYFGPWTFICQPTVLFFVVEMPFAINVPQSRYQNVEIVY